MRSLILSGIEPVDRTLEKEGVYKFLGPWCFIGNHDIDEYLKRYNFTPIFLSPSNLNRSSHYILGLSEHIVNFVAREMNEKHKVLFPDAYWSVLLGPTIIYFLQSFYRCYLQINNITELKEEFEVSIFREVNQINNKDTRESVQYVNSSIGQHHLYSIIIEELECANLHVNYVDYKPVDSSFDPETQQQLIVRNKRAHFRRIASLILSWVSFVYIESIPGVNLKDLIILHLLLIKYKISNKLVNLFYSGSNKKDVKNNFQGKCRSSINHEKYPYDKKFERIVKNNIIKFIPDSYGIHYHGLNNKVLKFTQFLPRVSVAVLGPIASGDDFIKMYIAHMKIRGIPVLISQHGSNYGIANSFTTQTAIEYKNADCFITWGWREHGNYSVKSLPLSSPLMSAFDYSYKISADKKIIFVGTRIPLISDRLVSIPEPERAMDYFNNKFEFISGLDSSIREQLYYRPYVKEHGAIPERAIVKKYIPDISFLEGDLNEHIKSAYCVVIDHPGTTMLLNLAYNIPTVLFWDAEDWHMCEQSKPYFQILSDCRILHSSPKKASDFLNNNWDDLHCWWNSKNVQGAREIFINQFAKRNDNWIKEWSEIFSIISAPK